MIGCQGKLDFLPFLVELPPFLEVLQKGLRELTVEASIALFRNEGNYLECCSILWNKEIQVIKGLLSLVQPKLAIVKNGLMQQIILSGIFEIVGIQLTAEVAFG